MNLRSKFSQRNNLNFKEKNKTKKDNNSIDDNDLINLNYIINKFLITYIGIIEFHQYTMKDLYYKIIYIKCI